MTEFWLFVLLGGAIVFLWRRVDRLEAALNEQARRAATARPSGEIGDAIVPATPADPAPAVQRDPGILSPPPLEPIPELVASAPPGPDDTAGVELDGRRPRFALSFDFEDLFGRLLPIWAGGVALAVAGFFLVRWSIEAGLLTVSVRVILGFLFGLALLAAAEAAYRVEHRVADPRVRQALAGAGLATLYASFYFAGSFYGLIGTTLAFLGLAAVTAAAIALSFRFGLPSAVLGLVGGFSAPVLVGSDEANLPLLTLYLALVAAGLTLTGRRQSRSWLGIASLAGGLGWGALLAVSGPGGGPDLVALGLYLIVLGAVLPAFSGGGRPGLWLRIGAAALASVQLAALVYQGGFGWLEWSLYLLLGGALAWFGWRFPAMREANAVAAAVALFLLAFWPAPPATAFAAVALGIAGLFGAVPLAQMWRTERRGLDVAQICGTALGLAVVAYGHFGHFAPGAPEPLLAVAALGLAGLPALAAWLIWPAGHAQPPRETLAAVACAVALLAFAGLLATPAWAAPLVAAAVVAGVVVLERGRDSAGLVRIARAVALVGLALLVVLPQVEPLLEDEFGRMAGYAYLDGGVDWRSPLRWLAAALGFLPLALRESVTNGRRVAEVFGAFAGYGAVAQILPASVLPWAIALAGLALAWRRPARSSALATLVVLAALWALVPFGRWTIAAAAALAGEAPGIQAWPTVRDALLRLAPLAALAAGATFLALRRGEPQRRPALIAGSVIALAALHSLYRHGFAAAFGTDFVATGLAQRTAWEAALLAGAIAFAKWRGERATGAILAATGLAHFAWFTLGVHNPLWNVQAVGPLPIVNGLLPAYALAIGALLLLRRLLPQAPPRWLFDAALMALFALLALSELRHAFSGSLLTAAPMSQGEDLLRSLIGIVLAFGFLLWGVRSGARSWRIGSLVLMLLAVLKVFLFDAAELEGLARIASFMALGFSLIGIGWFYARQLGQPAAAATRAGA